MSIMLKSGQRTFKISRNPGAIFKLPSSNVQEEGFDKLVNEMFDNELNKNFMRMDFTKWTNN